MACHQRVMETCSATTVTFTSGMEVDGCWPSSCPLWWSRNECLPVNRPSDAEFEAKMFDWLWKLRADILASYTDDELARNREQLCCFGNALYSPRHIGMRMMADQSDWLIRAEVLQSHSDDQLSQKQHEICFFANYLFEPRHFGTASAPEEPTAAATEPECTAAATVETCDTEVQQVSQSATTAVEPFAPCSPSSSSGLSASSDGEPCTPFSNTAAATSFFPSSLQLESPLEGSARLDLLQQDNSPAVLVAFGSASVCSCVDVCKEVGFGAATAEPLREEPCVITASQWESLRDCIDSEDYDASSSWFLSSSSTCCSDDNSSGNNSSAEHDGCSCSGFSTATTSDSSDDDGDWSAGCNCSTCHCSTCCCNHASIGAFSTFNWLADPAIAGTVPTFDLASCGVASEPSAGVLIGFGSISLCGQDLLATAEQERQEELQQQACSQEREQKQECRGSSPAAGSRLSRFMQPTASSTAKATALRLVKSKACKGSRV